jgi:hypothetical protein
VPVHRRLDDLEPHPIALFLLFQRLFLSGAGVSGALKG